MRRVEVQRVPDMPTHMSGHSEPSQEELAQIALLGRLDRLIAQGLTPMEAAAKLMEPESVEAYLARNAEARSSLEERLNSPEYWAQFAAIQAETDPSRKAALKAELKRANFAAIDMEAIHRTIRARNRQLKAEGILPPDAPE
jgi:hypothetical protein